MKKDYISIQDFSAEELKLLVDLVGVVKKASKERALPDLLRKRSVAMIFMEASTRTRISFEVAMTLLGGHGLYIKPGDIHLGKRETIADTSRVISSMCDGIVIRALHKDIVDMARYSSVPVINAMSDVNHPAQVLCDVFTMYEKMGRIKGVNLAFVGDTTPSMGNVPRDLMLLSSKLGINFYVASPEEYRAEEEFLKQVYKNAELSGSKIVVTEEPKEAVAQADFIYTGNFTWYGTQIQEIEERRKVFVPRYQVNPELMKAVPAHCKFMHYLPAMRGEEVTDDVIDSKQSIVFDEAENRLYTEEALLVAFIGKGMALSPVERERESKYTEEISEILERLS